MKKILFEITQPTQANIFFRNTMYDGGVSFKLIKIVDDPSK